MTTPERKPSAPTVVYDRWGVTVHHGDALAVLRAMPGASIHAIATDPPYGLAEHRPADVAAAITAWTTGDREFVPHSKGGFMGRDWDSFVPPPAVWDECARVLKPGGHMLVFAGTRTVDLMGLSVRLAGFEIRDGITWIYGTGFPKSLDVSKAIDKLNGRSMDLRYELARHIRERREHVGVTRAEVAARFPDYQEVTANWERTDEHGNRVPSVADWAILAPWLGLSESWLPVVERLEAEREVVRRSTDGASNGSVIGLGTARSMESEYDITAPATEAAKQWAGWGTALKPASEPIIVARKPLSGTVAANVLEHGTGGINIDTCRVESGPRPLLRNAGRADLAACYGAGKTGSVLMGVTSEGRWPANVVLTHSPSCTAECSEDCPVAELERQGAGTRAAKPSKSGPGGQRPNAIYGGGDGLPPRHDAIQRDDSGASRFFPVFRWEEKAPTSERPMVGGKSHPTVKPVDLMRWLVRLVTPPGGTVLDCFAGTGTTLQAARAEGFNAIGIEREAEYIGLIKARLDARPRQETNDAPTVPASDGPVDLLDLLSDGGGVA